MNKEQRSTARAVRIDPDIVLDVHDLIKTYTVGKFFAINQKLH